MRILWNQNFPAAVLAGGVLGLVICPYLYLAMDIVTGTLFTSFPPAFFLLILSPFLVGSGFLLWRFLSKPTDQQTSMRLLIMEGIGWTAVVVFLAYVSGANLQTGFGRFGLACALFLIAWAGCLPLVFMLKTALERRLAAMGSPLTVGVVLIILTISVVTTISYLTIPQRFI